MDWIQFTTARELRDFLNGIPAKALDVIHIEDREGNQMKGVRIRVNVLTDGSETVDYIFT